MISGKLVQIFIELFIFKLFYVIFTILKFIGI
jgi:hypothetical protein